VNNESGLKNSEKTEAVLKNAENLRRKMLVKKLMKSEGSTYSIDSGIYYLDVALNIQLADANSYTIEQDNFEKIIELNENQKDFNDIQMAEIFNNAIDYVDSVYNKINNAHKVINNISIKRLPIEDDQTQRKVSIVVVVGRTNLNNEVNGLYKTFPITYFASNMPSLRFTYNGGLCSQIYYEHYWIGPHSGQQVDIHGNVLGYETGAARELEKAINKCYSANTVLPIMTGPSTSKVILMPEVDMVTNSTLQPWDYTLQSGSPNIYSSNKHNPTRIFSYNRWDLNETHSNINVCLTGDMMNYYLNHAINIIDEAKMMYPLGAEYVYKRMNVNAYFKIPNVPPSNSLERSYNWNGQMAIPDTWGSPINDYYTYYKHTYRLFKAIPAVVADPNKM
jgi:hypothetical protein